MTNDDILIQFVDTLDNEIQLLSTIRYRLTVLGALAGADQGQLLPRAVQETESACEQLRLCELLRGTLAAKLADELEVDALARIDVFAENVEDAWSEILMDRRRMLLEAVAELQGLAESLTESMGRRAALAEAALSYLRSDKGTTYGRIAPRGGVIVEGAI